MPLPPAIIPTLYAFKPYKIVNITLQKVATSTSLSLYTTSDLFIQLTGTFILFPEKRFAIVIALIPANTTKNVVAESRNSQLSTPMQEKRTPTNKLKQAMAAGDIISLCEILIFTSVNIATISSNNESTLIPPSLKSIYANCQFQQ